MKKFIFEIFAIIILSFLVASCGSLVSLKIDQDLLNHNISKVIDTNMIVINFNEDGGIYDSITNTVKGYTIDTRYVTIDRKSIWSAEDFITQYLFEHENIYNVCLLNDSLVLFNPEKTEYDVYMRNIKGEKIEIKKSKNKLINSEIKNHITGISEIDTMRTNVIIPVKEVKYINYDSNYLFWRNPLVIIIIVLLALPLAVYLIYFLLILVLTLLILYLIIISGRGWMR